MWVGRGRQLIMVRAWAFAPALGVRMLARCAMIIVISFAALGGCAPKLTEKPLSEAALRGRAVYRSACITCHHPDPARDGSIGPAVARSSRELLEARVLRAEYPPGYTPKRASKAMRPLPNLANDIDALAAFLAE